MSAQIPSSEISQVATESALERTDTADNCYHYPAWRKWIVVAVMSWMTLAATFSSTSLLSAANEIASDFSTTAESINISSAGVLFAMGLSSFIWAPVGLVGQILAQAHSNTDKIADRWQESRIHRLRYYPSPLHDRNCSGADYNCVRGSACSFGTSGNVLPRSGTDDSRQILSTCK